jgi:hypothetical protein
MMYPMVTTSRKNTDIAYEQTPVRWKAVALGLLLLLPNAFWIVYSGITRPGR